STTTSITLSRGFSSCSGGSGVISSSAIGFSLQVAHRGKLLRLSALAAAEQQVGQPSCHQGGQDSNCTVGGRSFMGKGKEVCLQAQLADRKGCGLRTDDLAVSQKVGFSAVETGRHIGGQVNGGPKEPLAQDGDGRRLAHIEILALLVAD